MLVVDDDNDFRSLVTTALSNDGYEVYNASSGEAALNEARNREFDLILLDVKMPKMDGVQTLKLLRKETPSSDFMMLTGYRDIQTAVDSIKLGAKEYLTKPIEMSDLTTRVKSALRAHEAEVKLKEYQSEFTSRLLHELRTPIQTVKSAVSFLKKETSGPITEQQMDILNHIEDTVEKMTALVNDMIDLDKFESGKVDIEKLPTNLDELIPAVCSGFEPLVREKYIILNVNVDTAIPTLELDPDKIEQVVANLIDNAVKYTKNGGTVTVAAAVEQRKLDGKPREYVCISVADTGVGIPKEELPFVFDKYKEFFTGKTSEKKTTGIGLAISRSIIEAHNGMMSVDSAVGKGSTFKIYLPVS